MVAEADVEALREPMVDYLCRTMRGRLDAGTAHLVLARLLSHFVVPTHARGVESYVKSYLAWSKRYLSWDRRKEQSQVFNTRRVTGAGDFIAVDDTLNQLIGEMLPVTRPTLYRWARDWAMGKPAFAVCDDDGRLWLTKEGLAEARRRLIPKAITKLQLVRGKDTEAARKFTARHKRLIQEAITRGDKLVDIAKTLRLNEQGVASRASVGQ